MKKIIISTMVATLTVCFAASAQAAAHKQKVSAEVQASCKARAAKKFSAVHFVKRRNFVNTCVAEHGTAKVHAKAGTVSSDPASKTTTTG